MDSGSLTTFVLLALIILCIVILNKISSSKDAIQMQLAKLFQEINLLKLNQAKGIPPLPEQKVDSVKEPLVEKEMSLRNTPHFEIIKTLPETIVPEVVLPEMVAPEIIVQEPVVPKIVEPEPLVVQEVIKEDIKEDIKEEVKEEVKEDIKEDVEDVKEVPKEEIRKEEAPKEKISREEISKEFVRQVKPPKEKTEIERFFSENLLSKIGIVTLVLGIAYYVKYAIDENMISEGGRVAIGILTGGLIIGVAHKIRAEYKSFSALLVGGGISVLYITITLAFRQYNLINMPVAFTLLTLITIFSVLLSLLYDQKVLALFSLLGGFAAPLMISTSAGNYVALFSYLLLLNTGMLVLAQRKRWMSISVVSYVLTQIFFWSWLTNRYVDEQAGTICFACLFFVQFYALALIEHFKSNRALSWFQASVVLGSNFSLYLAALVVFKDVPAVRGVITLVVALVNVVPMYVLYKRKSVDKQFLYLLIAIVFGFATLTVPMQLNGCRITLFWATEVLIMLWMWQKSEIKMFRLGYLILQVLTLVSLGMDLGQQSGYYLVTGLYVSVTLFASLWLLGKEDASSRFISPRLDFCKVSTWIRIIRIVAILTLYITPLVKICCYRVSMNAETPFLIGVYSYSFIAVMAAYKWIFKQHSKNMFGLLILSCGAFFYFMNNMASICHVDALNNSALWDGSWFNWHYLYLPAMAVIVTYAWKLKELFSPMMRAVVGWFLAVVTIWFVCVELDNIGIALFFDHSSVEGLGLLTKKIHTVVYPIVWGLMAIVIMIWGLKWKDLLLRRISLALFSLIIAKLYLIDIWDMDKSNKILAFIALGILLLAASFIFQKIKKKTKL